MFTNPLQSLYRLDMSRERLRTLWDLVIDDHPQICWHGWESHVSRAHVPQPFPAARIDGKDDCREYLRSGPRHFAGYELCCRALTIAAAAPVGRLLWEPLGVIKLMVQSGTRPYQDDFDHVSLGTIAAALLTTKTPAAATRGTGTRSTSMEMVAYVTRSLSTWGYE